MPTTQLFQSKPSCRDLLKETDEEVKNENVGWISFFKGQIWIYIWLESVARSVGFPTADQYVRGSNPRLARH